MKAQYENKVVSSTLLWLDNTVLTKGEAYTNHGSEFYEAEGQWYGYHTYGAPFKQFVSDFSVPSNAPTDPSIPTGVYVSGTFRPKGVSGLVDIDYNNGHVYFDHKIASGEVSGNYAVKDFNIYLTNKLEQELLFETKVDLRAKTVSNPSAIAANTITYPAIFIKNLGGRNEPWAFGGADLSLSNIRAIALADSQFTLDALCSIIKDKARTMIPLVESNNYPYNALGGYKNSLWQYDGVSVYNYTELTANAAENLYIKDVYVSQFNVNYVADMKNANPDVFSAIIDIDLEQPRRPRE